VIFLFVYSRHPPAQVEISRGTFSVMLGGGPPQLQHSIVPPFRQMFFFVDSMSGHTYVLPVPNHQPTHHLSSFPHATDLVMILAAIAAYAGRKRMAYSLAQASFRPIVGSDADFWSLGCPLCFPVDVIVNSGSRQSQIIFWGLQ
jgi:hypothetical protein